MISKEEQKSIGLSALASVVAMCAVLGPVGWYLIKPVLVTSVSTSMAEDLDDTIGEKLDAKLMPLNAGFKAVLQQNIASLRRQIADMEYREANDPEWTAQDAGSLAQLEIDLDGQIAAYRAILRAENQ